MTALESVPPLLVIAHEATRTGAPRVLLDLLTPLKATLPVPLAIRLESGGPLARALMSLEDSPDDDRADGPGLGRPCAVLVNSALAAEAVLEFPDVPAALYVHEDRSGLDALSAAARSAIITRYTRVMCVSERVAADLVGLGVAAERTRVVPPIVNPPPASSPRDLAAARDALGAQPGDRIVLGCGEGGWRKGADLFVALAHRILDRHAPHTRFIFGWAGLRPLPFARHLDHEVATLGLGDHIRWLGEVERPEVFLEAADVVVMTSRNDPQPLVPVEAALLGTPTVGFAVGGMVDLERSGAAVTVPYPDLGALAGVVVRIATSPTDACDLVEHSRGRWQERQSPAVAGALFRAVLDNVLPSVSPSSGRARRIEAYASRGGDPWP